MVSQELHVGDTWQCTVTPLSAWLTGPTNSSNTLTILALSQLNLAWNQTTLSLGSVAQGASAASNATVTATGDHTSVVVTPVAGNGTAFINATPLSLGNMNDTNTSQVKFNCSPSGSQAAGYYEAVFKVNSSNFTTGSNITVSCNVTGTGAPALTWNQSSLGMGSVQQATSSAKNATVTASGNDP
jgi:hypothetical protein